MTTWSVKVWVLFVIKSSKQIPTFKLVILIDDIPLLSLDCPEHLLITAVAWVFLEEDASKSFVENSVHD